MYTFMRLSSPYDCPTLPYGHNVLSNPVQFDSRIEDKLKNQSQPFDTGVVPFFIFSFLFSFLSFQLDGGIWGCILFSS